MAGSCSSPKPNRKLVVLDLDNTLCDFSYLEHLKKKKEGDSARPFLNYFLTMVYEHYDIMIWSATDYGVIQDKLVRLGISRSREYKIIECLDYSEMAVVESAFGSVQVKSLDVIWKKYPMYDQTNTIIIDDQYVNFFQTPNNGLQIKPYFHCMYYTDNELFLLATYLDRLAKFSNDFSQENHRNWKKYNPKPQK